MSGLEAPVNLTWTPPAASSWNFTPSRQVCDAASEWTGAYIVAYSTYEEDGRHPVPLSFSIEYLSTILPSDFHQNTTNASLAAWYYQNIPENTNGSAKSLKFWQELMVFPIKNCSNEVCQKIGWKEDPDIAGVGVCT
jgi:hypothetical protein